MAGPFQVLSECGVPLLVIGPHAAVAHHCACETRELECAITTSSESTFGHYLALNGWNTVYRTPFFSKYRQLSTGNPVIKVKFLDATTFQRLVAASVEFTFDDVALRVPSLMHLIAMKLQDLKTEPHREIDELPEILALLRANSGRWDPAELAACSERFGPPGICERLTHRLGN